MTIDFELRAYDRKKDIVDIDIVIHIPELLITDLHKPDSIFNSLLKPDHNFFMCLENVYFGIQ